MGKHQRAIITGAFGGDNLFALGSEDTSITVNNIDGDTVHTFSCSGEPEFLQFTRFRRVDDRPNDRSEDYVRLANFSLPVGINISRTVFRSAQWSGARH